MPAHHVVDLDLELGAGSLARHWNPVLFIDFSAAFERPKLCAEPVAVGNMHGLHFFELTQQLARLCRRLIVPVSFKFCDDPALAGDSLFALDHVPFGLDQMLLQLGAIHPSEAPLYDPHHRRARRVLAIHALRQSAYPTSETTAMYRGRSAPASKRRQRLACSTRVHLLRRALRPLRPTAWHSCAKL